MNRNLMLAMTRLGLSFDPAGGEGGGGAAVAAPPAAGGAGSGGGSGGGAGAGAGAGARGAAGSGSGFFYSLPKKDLAAVPPIEKGAADGAAAAEEGQGAAGAAAGLTVKTPEQLAAEETARVTGTKTPEQLEAEKAAAAGGTSPLKITDDTVFDTPIYGRFKTKKEVEAGLHRSEQEGVRLATEVKKARADAEKALATREAELVSLRAELEMVRKTPPFRELTKEEYAALVKENPDAAIDYRFAQRDHDQAVQKAKEDAARQYEARRTRLEAANAEIQRHDFEMRSDSKAYPMFEELNPSMAHILDITGGENSPLRGQVWANELLYRAALGNIYIGLLAKGEAEKGDAAAAARATAEAAAKATAAAGKGAGGGSKPSVDPEYKKWSDAVDAAAPKKILSGLKD